MKRTQSGCDEYRGLTRRHFLGGSVALGAGALATNLALPRVASAGGGVAANHTLIYILLRGGIDGLSVCVPYTESAYYDARPTLAVPPPGAAGGALALDGQFALNPVGAALMPLYTDGRLALLHAAGSTDDTRSHFLAFSKIELGVPAQSLAGVDTGWMARHLADVAAAAPGAPLRATALADFLPPTLAAAPNTIAMPDPTAFAFPGQAATADLRAQILGDAYAAAQEPVKATAASTLAAVEAIEALGLSGYAPDPGVSYPDTDFGGRMRSAAALLKADMGLEAIVIEFGGFDHHSAQGPLDGDLALLFAEFADAVAAFDADCAAVSDRFTLLAHSEFGRRLAENSSAGTDHGRGGVMFLLGDGVAGGQVHTAWPGLAEAQLDDGDLQVTTDYRDVLGEILVERLGAPSLASIFPNHAYAPLGLLG